LQSRHAAQSFCEAIDRKNSGIFIKLTVLGAGATILWLQRQCHLGISVGEMALSESASGPELESMAEGTSH